MRSSSKSDRRSDAELVDTCNHGDAAQAIRAFETLYRRHKDYVFRIAFRYTRDRELALDVLQETFGFLLRTFPPPGGGLTLTARLTTFLYPVIKNYAVTAARKAGRYASSGVEPDSLPAAPAESAAADIAAVLDELPAERREVMQLRFLDDMPLQDIATALGIPLGTVKSRLHLAVKQLKNSAAAKNLLNP